MLAAGGAALGSGDCANVAAGSITLAARSAVPANELRPVTRFVNLIDSSNGWSA
jgi:hypothetical protein